MAVLEPVIAKLLANTAEFTASMDEAKAKMAAFAAEADAAGKESSGSMSGLGTSAHAAGNDVKTAAEDASGSLGNLGSTTKNVEGDLSDLEGTSRDVKSGLTDAETAANDTGNALSGTGKGAKEAKAGMSDAESGSGKLSKGLSTVATFGKWAGLAVVGLGVVSVKTAATFQMAMTNLVTGAGESEKNIKMVSAGILSMASIVGMTATQLAAGMYMVESAGYHGAAGLAVLKASAEGAAVGHADLASVANAVTSALNAYHLKASAAVSITNQMIATVASGKMHFDDLARSLGSVLPIAASAHISFAQIGGAMSTMTMQGMTTRRAAMNLATMIRAMVAPGPAAAAEMKNLGLNANELSTHIGKVGLTGTLDEMTAAILRNTKGGMVLSSGFNQMNPAAKSLATSILAGTISTKALSTATQALSPEQAALVTKFASTASSATGLKETFDGAMKKMVGGATGLNVALLLGGKNASTFAANVHSVGEAADKSGHSVTGFAKVQKDLAFQFDQLKAEAESLMIKIGGALMPAVSKLAPVFGRLLTAIAPVITVLGTVLAKAVTALMPVITNLINDGILPLAKAFGPVLSAVAGLIPPLMKLLAPVIKVASAFLQQLMPSLTQIVKQGIMPLIQILVPLMPALLQLINPVLKLTLLIVRWTADLLTFKPVLYAIGVTILLLTAPISLVVVAILELMTHWTRVWNTIKSVTEIAWNFLYDDIIRPIVRAFEVLLKPVIDYFEKAWAYDWNLIKTVAEGVWHLIWNDILQPIIHAFVVLLTPVIQAFQKIWSFVWNILKTDAEAAWRVIDGGIIQPMEKAFGVLGLVVNVFKAVWSTMWNTMKSIATTVWGTIDGSIIQPVEAVFKTGLTQAIDGFKSAWSGMWNAMKSIAVTVWGTIQNTVISPMETALSAGSVMWQTLFGGGGGGGGSMLPPVPSTTPTGGVRTPKPPKYLPHLAGGGPAMAGSPYFVGENGPEIFVPSASGNVLPNPSSGVAPIAPSGGSNNGGNTYNVVISGAGLNEQQLANLVRVQLLQLARSTGTAYNRYGGVSPGGIFNS